MQCQHARHIIDRQTEPGALPSQVSAHLRNCELCRQYAEDSRLRQTLQALQVPAPEPGFLEAALQRAQTPPRIQPLRPWRWYGAAGIAASVLLLITLLVGGPEPTVPQVPVQAERVPVQAEPAQASTEVAQRVRVMIHSEQDVAHAEISIQLAENLELEGYAGQRQLTWTTPLRRGPNLLTLPVLVRAGGGELQVVSRFGGREHAVTRSLPAPEPVTQGIGIQPLLKERSA